MHEVLREYLHRFVLVYIDDILIYSRSLAEHRHQVAEVLQRLRQYQLFLKAEKCSFHQSSVQFLGYHIDSCSIRMDKGKVEAILRKDRGFPGTTFWIRLSRRSSMPNSLIVQHLEPGVDHHVVGPLGPLERAVERGVVSQISQAPPPIRHYDLNHLSSDSRHLHLINHPIYPAL